MGIGPPPLVFAPGSAPKAHSSFFHVARRRASHRTRIGNDASVTSHPIFAAVYDRMLASAERAGLGEMRATVLAEATGRTLELGAGTGANLEHYPPSVTGVGVA